MLLQTTTRPAHGAARAEERGEAPALARAERTGFIAHAEAPARLRAPGAPMSRRRRLRDRLGGRLAGSGLAHLLALVLLSALFAREHTGGQMAEPQPVEMLFDHRGSSGGVGPTTPNPPTHAAEQPAPPRQAPPPLPPPPPPRAETAPELPAPPPPLPEAALPEPLPLPQPQPQPPSVPQPSTRAAPQARHAPSPFAHPMDLSFSQAVPHPRTRSGRPGGGGAPINLSIGPLVRNGQLNTPYASTTTIRGVSDDYEAELSNWIRRHMYYPEDAARRGEDGPSRVVVKLDRQGNVRSIRLVSSSGSWALDDATQGMFRGARLPPVPPDMAGDHFDVDLTIDYILIRR